MTVISNQLAKRLGALAILMLAMPAIAADFQQYGLSLAKIRAVGDYQGTMYDSTVELWFSTPVAWPAGSKCTNNDRVYIDAKNSHLIAAAYMALTSGKKVNINADDALPIRYGSCEVSFIDVGSQ